MVRISLNQVWTREQSLCPSKRGDKDLLELSQVCRILLCSLLGDLRVCLEKASSLAEGAVPSA